MTRNKTVFTWNKNRTKTRQKLPKIAKKHVFFHQKRAKNKQKTTILEHFQV